MTVFLQILFAALAAVTTENLLFSGGIGFSRVLRAARKPNTLALYSLLIALYSMAAMLINAGLYPFFQDGDLLIFVRPAVFTACIVAVYAISAVALKTLAANFYKKYGSVFSLSAINTVVLSMPYAQKSFKLGLPEAAGFALGTGAAFFLAAVVLSYATGRFRDEEMPKAFSGMPAAYLYIGILSLAFAGLTGGKLF
ncbi:MAG TPA: Rnf-Nqr domain containing protein [Caproiciproducens sp.]|nr:Rnf-Nqr domain containing protein [Caproiciproducens sp.]